MINDPFQLIVSFWNKANFMESFVWQHAWYYFWARAYESMSHSIPTLFGLDVVDSGPFWIFRMVMVSPCTFNCILVGFHNALHVIFLGLSKSPDDLRDSSMLGIGPLRHIRNIVIKIGEYWSYIGVLDTVWIISSSWLQDLVCFQF